MGILGFPLIMGYVLKTRSDRLAGLSNGLIFYDSTIEYIYSASHWGNLFINTDSSIASSNRILYKSKATALVQANKLVAKYAKNLEDLVNFVITIEEV